MHKPTLSLIRHADSGFTLAELAIVLIIISLLAGGLMTTLGAQLDMRNNAETQQRLQEARDALLGFAASRTAGDGKPYLPCPDTDGDGLENRAGAACAAYDGTLPFADLGISGLDGWSNRFRYHVQPNFSRNDVGFTLSTAATLRVCDQAACTSVLANNLPAIVLSHGKNGFGATTSGNLALPAPSSADELENSDGDANFVSHTPSSPGPNEFDDQVAWLSPNILYNRMIAAGRLP